MYVPSYALTADGRGVVLSLNGVVVLTAPLLILSRQMGSYTVGTAYKTGDIVYNPADGCGYFVSSVFTATVVATDISTGNLSINVKGVPLPIPSKMTFDATQNLTLDKVIANFVTQFASINAAIAKIQANGTAINTRLGNDGVSGFPLTLQ